METVVQPPAGAELNLLTVWGDPAGRVRTGRAAVLSVLVHIAAVVFLLAMPETIMQPAYRNRQSVVTPLIEPPLELTQKEPNRGKLHTEINATDLHPRMPLPPSRSPNPEPPAPRRTATTPPPPPASPPSNLPEPPKVDLPANSTPKLTLPVAVPQIQAEEKSRPAFEDVTAPRQVPPEQRVLEVPSVARVINGNLHGPGGNSPGVAIVPQSAAELPQLLSDPQGVDFKPYLAQVLAAVKQYWYRIMPETVRMGRAGRVAIQFAILRDGSVGKMAYAERTGVSSLDNAGLFAISGAAPFPQLPAQYKGSEIRVQVNFAYNVPKQ